jgi:hypothetical protein
MSRASRRLSLLPLLPQQQPRQLQQLPLPHQQLLRQRLQPLPQQVVLQVVQLQAVRPQVAQQAQVPELARERERLLELAHHTCNRLMTAAKTQWQMKLLVTRNLLTMAAALKNPNRQPHLRTSQSMTVAAKAQPEASKSSCHRNRELVRLKAVHRVDRQVVHLVRPQRVAHLLAARDLELRVNNQQMTAAKKRRQTMEASAVCSRGVVR